MIPSPRRPFFVVVFGRLAEILGEGEVLLPGDRLEVLVQVPREGVV